MQLTAPTPLEVLSIHLQYPGSNAIPLRDPTTHAFLGDKPEWILGQRNVPAAYVRGSKVTMKLVFNITYLPPCTVEIFAIATNGDVIVNARPFKIKSNGARITEPMDFETAKPLPDTIGRHEILLQWFARWTDGLGIPCQVLIGVTDLTVCTTWRPMKLTEAEELESWVYTPLMLWTSEWCAGLDDEKAICDAIIQGLPQSGLRYGFPGWTVRFILLTGGGMCGGWYQMFQMMAHCQGIHVERRTFYLSRPPRLDEEQTRWQSLCTADGGLNNPSPTWQVAIPGHYTTLLRSSPPEPGEETVFQQDTRLYLFVAYRYGIYDGHCVNFLEYQGKLFVYDASFQKGGIELEGMTLPPKNLCYVPGNEMVSFRKKYLIGTLNLMPTLELLDAPLAGGSSIAAKGYIREMAQVEEVGFYWGP